MGYDSLGDWHSTKKISKFKIKKMQGMVVTVVSGLHTDVSEGLDFTVYLIIMILPDDKSRLQELNQKNHHLWKFLECDEKKKKILELENEMSAPAFWDDQANARKVGSESNRLKQTVSRIEDFRSEVEDLEALCELCEEDENDQEMAREFVSTLESLLSKIDDIEVASFLNEPFDARPALLSIHAGAGGTESCDWADMLMRMYTRWAERSGF